MLATEQIKQSFPPQLIRRALQLYEGGAVDIYDVEADGTTLHITASVRERLEEHELSIELDGQSGTVRSYCDCEEGSGCVHMVAALLAIADETSKPPVTPQEAQKQRTVTILDMLTVPQMRKIAKRHKWKLKGTLKADITSQLADYLQAALQDGSLMAGLSPKQARLLAAIHMIHDVNSGVDSAEITATYRSYLNQKGTPKTLLQDLFESGILAKDTYSGSTVYISTVQITAYDIGYIDSNAPVFNIKLLPASRFGRTTERPPQQPIQHAMMQLGQLASSGLTSAAAEWDEAEDRETNPFFNDNWPMTKKDARTLHASNRYNYMFDERKIDFPVQKKLLDDRSAEMLSNTLGSPDKAEWLFELLIGGNLDTFFTSSQHGNTTQYRLQDEQWQTFQAKPEELQIRFFFTGWAATGNSKYELRKLLHNYPDWTTWRLISPGLTYSYLHQNIAGAHQTVIRFLGQLAVQSANTQNDWVQLDQFVKRIGELRPHLYQTATGPIAWGFSYKGKEVNNEGNRRWANTYGMMVRYLFDGPLYWFGMVDIRESNGRIKAFRLTDLGRWLLAPMTTSMAAFVATNAQEPSVVTWQDDGALTLERGYDMGAMLTVINRFMHADATSLGRYTLDGSRLERAFAAGEQPATIASAFASIRAPLPDAVRGKIDELHAQYGHVHLYENLTVIEFSDEFALAELRAASVIEPDDIIHEFSPRLVVINDSAADKIIKAMQKKKFTPRVIA